MKLKFIFFTFCAVFFALYQSANAETNNNDANEPPVYTQDKLNISIDKEHTKFIIKLKSNPTTGFTWFLREYDKTLVTPIGHEFTAPTKKLIGAGGYELWTFQMKPQSFTVPQQTAIRFVYARPWQSDGGTQVMFMVNTQGK